jgi:hypothetical protein
MSSGSKSALDYLAPDARREFVDSIVYVNGEVASYRAIALQSLTAKERSEVLTLVGVHLDHPMLEGFLCESSLGECIYKPEDDCDEVTCAPGAYHGPDVGAPQSWQDK